MVSGRITIKNLKRVAKELGENLTDEEIQEMSEWPGRRRLPWGSCVGLTMGVSESAA